MNRLIYALIGASIALSCVSIVLSVGRLLERR